MNLFIAVSFLLVAALVAVWVIYQFLIPSPPTKKKQPLPVSARKPPPPRTAPPLFRANKNGGVEIPAEIPRNIDTVRIITEEHPDLTLHVVKTWMNEKHRREVDVKRLKKIAEEIKQDREEQN